jgi:hypothetical protein
MLYVKPDASIVKGKKLVEKKEIEQEELGLFDGE